MKTAHLTACLLSGALLAPIALANPTLARSWSDEAKVLEARINTSPDGNLPDDLKSDIQRFGRVAGRLANAGSAENPLPHDLGCIFRGMKEETDLQLSHLQPDASADEVTAARVRLSKMFDDAVDVGQSAALALEAGEVLDISDTEHEPGQCKASWGD